VKILLVNPYDLTHPGGVTNHVFDLAEQFRLMGHEADIIGPAGQGLLPQNTYTHSIGYTMRFITPGDRARINLSPFVYGAVEKFLRNREYDVYHLHEPFLGFIGPAFLRLGDGVKVGTFHTTREGPHLGYILGWPLVQHWNRRLQGHIAVADSAMRTVKRYVRAKYRIIPNGVNFDRFATPQPLPRHLTDERPVVLYAGRIESRKGIPHLLKAFQLLKQSMKSARLVIVGEGGLRAMYMKQAEEMGLEDVTWEGFVAPDYLPSFYQRADVFVSPSTVNESFGITLLEAMSAGAPAVATSVNGTTTLGEDGVTGLIVPPKDEPAMAAAMQRLLEDRGLAKRLSEAAQERARRFDWENVANELLDYYAELGAQGR
jgi:phosphatidyl-myo-inositol alpha-mannosyltransferase